MRHVTPSEIDTLAVALEEQLFAALLHKLRAALSQTEAKAALARGLQAGLTALLLEVSSHDLPDETALAVLHEFCHSADVGREIAGVLRGRTPDTPLLAELFAETTPMLDWHHCLDAFVAVLLLAAANEPALREPLASPSLLAQTHLPQPAWEQAQRLLTVMGSAGKAFSLAAGQLFDANAQPLFQARLRVTEPWHRAPAAKLWAAVGC